MIREDIDKGLVGFEKSLDFAKLRRVIELAEILGFLGEVLALNYRISLVIYQFSSRSIEVGD